MSGTGGLWDRVTAGGSTPRVTANMVRPASAPAYTAGDLIGNAIAAPSTVPIEFAVARFPGGSGRISGGECTLSVPSGTIVLPAFDLILFRPTTDIPFPVGGYPADNSALVISAAAYIQVIGVLSFQLGAWRNSAGGATAAGLTAWQAVGFSSRIYATFNLAGLNTTKILGLMQAQSGWAPGSVDNTFDLALDVDQD